MSTIDFCTTDRKLNSRVRSKGLSESRIRTTNIVFNEIYGEFGYTPSDLLDRARKDEEQYIVDGVIKQKPLDDRIVSEIQDKYLVFLENKVYRGRRLLPNTIVMKITILRSFFSYYHIELPNSPNIVVPKTRPTDEDIPSWEDVNDALPNCKSPRDKALIAFAVTTGLRLSDIASRKISHFIEACSIYFEENEEHTLDNLLKKDPSQIIPCWELMPQKLENSPDNQNSFTITFNTPECTEFIYKYLKYRMDIEKRHGGDGTINPNEALFRSERRGNKEGHLQVTSIEYQFRSINKKLGDDKQKNKVYGKFAAHGLRKLFKTTCRRNLPRLENTSDMKYVGDIVSLFTGHASKYNNMDDIYVAIPKDSKDSFLRKAYQQLVPYLSIRPTTVKDVSSDEYKQLQAENDDIRKKYENLQKSMDSQKENYEQMITDIKNEKDDELNNLMEQLELQQKQIEETNKTVEETRYTLNQITQIKNYNSIYDSISEYVMENYYYESPDEEELVITLATDYAREHMDEFDYSESYIKKIITRVILAIELDGRSINEQLTSYFATSNSTSMQLQLKIQQVLDKIWNSKTVMKKFFSKEDSMSPEELKKLEDLIGNELMKYGDNELSDEDINNIILDVAMKY